MLVQMMSYSPTVVWCVCQEKLLNDDSKWYFKWIFAFDKLCLENSSVLTYYNSAKSISAFPWETEVSSLNSVNVVACSRAQKQRIVHSLTDLRVLSTGTSLFVIDSVIRETFVVFQ